MRVAHLSLADYRNYATAEVPFAAGPNLLVGRNGQGKTNLAEAIAYFATLRSHRVTGDAALIRAGEESAILRMRVEAAGRDVLLEAQINRDRPNRAQVNRNAVRPRELTRWFSMVLFAPEDLGIVRGDPSGRRRFLDDAVIARTPALSGTLSDYERVVRQRTSLLKSARSGARNSVEATLDVWDAQLVEHGSRIMLARRELLRGLEEPLRAGYETLVEQDHGPKLSLLETVASARERGSVSRETSPSASFTPGEGSVSRETEARKSSLGVSRETIASEFREALRAVRPQELDRGLTLVGPHRDDMLLELNGLPVKGYASHGESWSFALALRLGMAVLLRGESAGGDPVILLDDVFAELDTRRRSKLMSAVQSFEQVIVTAAVEEDIPEGIAWHRIGVERGVVTLGSAER